MGIDISKDFFDYCVIDKNCKILTRGQNENSSVGIKILEKTLKFYKEQTPWVGMEHTGHYGSLLCIELTKRNIQFSLLNSLELKKT